MIVAERAATTIRTRPLLEALGIPRSSYYSKRCSEPCTPGRKPMAVPQELVEAVRALAAKYPWWGYKRIAVVARREGWKVSNKQVYKVFREAGLFQRRPVREATVHQAVKLFELLPQAPNELWQTDVTYLHIPGSGWWYAVTVIDYYSRYLLACYFTPSYSADQITTAVDLARAAARPLGPAALSGDG